MYTDENGEQNDDATQRFACEIEFHCASPKECPEALFDWHFNDRPIRSLSGAEMIKIRQSDQLRKRGGGQMDDDDDDDGVWVQQRSELEVAEQFAKGNIGRFACHSLFGGATAELRPLFSEFSSLALSIDEIGTTGAKISWRMLGKVTKSGDKNSQKRRRFYGNKSEFAGNHQTLVLEMRTKRERIWRIVNELRVPTTGGQNWAGHFRMDRLEANERYQFRLRPIGEGTRAVAISEWMRTEQTVPTETVQHIRFRMLDDAHILLEWDPVEKTHQSAPNLRYNVTWNTLTSAEGQSETIETQSRTVTEPRLIISLPMPLGGENRAECAILEVGVRAQNERGASEARTDTVIRTSSKEPQRYAVDLRLDSVNATHLNLSWNWQNIDSCENVIGAKIMCEEIEEEEEGTGPLRKRGEGNGSPNSSDPQMAASAASPLPFQSIPFHYSHWLVHSLRPLREYECRVAAFDQFGRMGPIRADGVRAKTKEKAPEGKAEIISIKVGEKDNGTYALMVEWKAVKLTMMRQTEGEGQIAETAEGGKENGAMTADNAKEKDQSWDRGYKLFVYVSETADKPILLRLTKAELYDPQRPSARIDGLRPMFLYIIQIAAFNPGGIGPLSERIPVRIGARHKQNPDLVTAMEGNRATPKCKMRRSITGEAAMRSLITTVLLIQLCRRHY